MKKIILLALSIFMLASCTLYMDNDDSTDNGKTENGDGFNAPHTDNIADGTITYQFNPTTRVFDDANSQYVVSVDDTVVWLSTSIPYDHLPQVGDAVYSRFTKTFPEGMMAKVLSVTKENGMVKCVCTKTSLGHVFKNLDVKLSIPIADYVDSLDSEESLADIQSRAMSRTRDVESLEKPAFSFGGTFKTSDFSKDDTNGSWYSFDRNMYGRYTNSTKCYMKVDFDLSLSERSFRCVFIDSMVVKEEVAIGGQGEMSLRLLGPTNNFKNKFKLKSIPVGTLPIKIGIQPSVVASAKGSFDGGIEVTNYAVYKVGIYKNKDDEETHHLFDVNMNSFENPEKTLNVSASVGVKLGLSIDVTDKTESFHAGLTPYIEPGVKLESGCKMTSEGTCLTTPGTIRTGAEMGLDIFAKVNFFDNDIYRWDYNLANHYLTWKVANIDPQLVSMEMVPDEMSSSESVLYTAKVSITDMGKNTYRTPMVVIYDDKGIFVKNVELKLKKQHDGIYDFVGEFELDKTDNVGYVAEMCYTDRNGHRYYYDDRIPFGVKIDMVISDFRQASSMMDFSDSKMPWTFEARGILKRVGSIKASKWGIRFEMFNEKGQKVGKAQNAYFELKDGKVSWGIKIKSKNHGPYKLQATPFYHTGYGIKEKTYILENRISKISLDPSFGECKEPDWAEPDTYVELNDK